ncbi:MAG: helix-turn-helix domain-containing protein [Methanosarcinaceae archaeon]|nr:helix-turn-helix domain-containing protein [Methanosarcinaceae archaeon]
MSIADKVIYAAFDSDEAFQQMLPKVIREYLEITAIEFSELAGIPHSTLYKLMSGNREPNMRTLRQIVKTIRTLEGEHKGEFIAVIASRPVLDNITETKRKIGDQLCTIREYSATSMEEAIIAAVRAEQDGAKGLVCAPIVSPTIEKIIQIPVSTIMPKNSLIDAIENVARKIK